MWLVKQIEQAVLGPIYGLAIWLRSGVWRLRRTTLIGVRALIVRDGAVLLIRHRSGKQPWALPGGGVKRNERLAEAARREAHEETGAPIRVERLLGVYDRFGDRLSNYVVVFVCTALGEPHPPRSNPKRISKSQQTPAARGSGSRTLIFNPNQEFLHPAARLELLASPGWVGAARLRRDDVRRHGNGPSAHARRPFPHLALGRAGLHDRLRRRAGAVPAHDLRGPA
jgi:ADP-ribose pyrophosphatase YjhB (NUDIX family)